MNQSASIQSSNSNNVVALNLNTVFSDIQSHLRDASFSESTKTAYEADLRQFFSFTRNGKALEDLTLEDLKFKNSEIKNYQSHLKTTMKNTTVNRKMKSIMSLYKSLIQSDYELNDHAMEVKNLSNDSVKHGFLTFEETEKMADFALYHNDGLAKYALIKLAVRSSLRKQDLLDLTWDDIYVVNELDEKNQITLTKYYLIVVEEKTGKRTRKNFSEEMYNSLVKIKSDTDNKVFHISLRVIEGMMDKLNKQMKFDARRGITFHSLRKAAAGYVLEETGDIKAAADQLGHSNINTTNGYYVEDQGNIAGLMMDEKIDKDIFEQLSREEMLKLLNSLENGVGASMRRKAKNIVENRK